MEKKETGDTSVLKELQSFRCDNTLQFPYYPVVTMIIINSETFVAAKSRDTIIVYVFKNSSCIRSYSLNSNTLPSRSFITTILFVDPSNLERYNYDQKGSLYMLIGYYCGYLYLVKINNKEIKIIYKYNKVSEPGIFSKTMSYFSGSNSSQYSQWKNATVISLKVSYRWFSYLFRNSTLVITGNLQSSLQDLQKKHDWLLSQDHLPKNQMKKTQKYYYFICNQYKLIKNGQKCIISFDSTISSHQIDQSSLFVATYDGIMIQFDKENYTCKRKISTSIAIKHLNIVNNFVVLCLEDDITQIVDLTKSSFVNLTGHRSFINCALPLKSILLLGSYDGFISITDLNKIKKWNKLQNSKGKIQSTFTLDILGSEVDQKSKLKCEVGIGTGLIIQNTLVLSIFDNTVKVFKINMEQLSS